MAGHIHDAISFHIQIDAEKDKDRNHFERSLSENRVNIVFMTKPNIILYTLHDEQSRVLYSGGVPNNVKVTDFKRSIIEITNFSIEKELRVGVLLADGDVAVYNLYCNRWTQRNTITTNIDFSLKSEVVFARTLNACFWVERESPKNSNNNSSDKNAYKVCIHTLLSGTTRTILKGIPACIIQCLQGTLALLFHEHGVLFVEFKQIYGDTYHEMLRLTMTTQSSEDIRISNHQALSRSSSVPMLAQPTINQIKQGYYWNPETDKPVTLKDVNAQLFAKPTRNKLRSHCLDKDRIELIVLYGDTVYRLTTQVCLPIIKLHIPDYIIESSQIYLMHLKRVTVLIGDNAVVAYRGSCRPVITSRKSFKVAKYGHVWNKEGLFRINMNSPDESKPRFDSMEAINFDWDDNFKVVNDYFVPPPTRPNYIRYPPPHGNYARG